MPHTSSAACSSSRASRNCFSASSTCAMQGSSAERGLAQCIHLRPQPQQASQPRRANPLRQPPCSCPAPPTHPLLQPTPLTCPVWTSMLKGASSRSSSRITKALGPASSSPAGGDKGRRGGVSAGSHNTRGATSTCTQNEWHQGTRHGAAGSSQVQQAARHCTRAPGPSPLLPACPLAHPRSPRPTPRPEPPGWPPPAGPAP